tara:strand:- start:22 stop:2241 length:2220 start_codon:yes stop_codon:yes gene_type:complete
MGLGKELLYKFKSRWQLILYAEVLIYAIGVFALLYGVFLNSVLAIISALVIGVIITFVKQPWTKDINKTVGFIDANLKEATYSSGLLLVSDQELTSLSKLQQYNVSQEIKSKLQTLTPPNTIRRALLVSCLLIIIGGLGYKTNVFKGFSNPLLNAKEKSKIIFTPIDSVSKNAVLKPELSSQKITIIAPNYARVAKITTENPNVKALVNSSVSWELSFNKKVSEVVMELNGKTQPLELTEEGYYIKLQVKESGIYNFRFKDLNRNTYLSDLYSIEAVGDEAPKVEISGIPQYSYFDFGQENQIQFTTSLIDDYGIDDAYIIATVSKGTGESVKFREEKISFNNEIKKGAKQLQLGKKIRLNDLKMEMGDELYFYVEVFDQKQPKPNRSRSETFFAVIKDTSTNLFAVEGALGVDQMPDYFRSQRQLIIDTEKLIKERSKLTKEDFKFKSNELGFDQKALRLKYGQFMGDESEMDVAPNEMENEKDHDQESENHEDDDPLEKYTHDHDGANEQHLVPEKAEEKEDPLHDYIHNHSDPEEATLFEESLKTKLRKALNIMWDAELHLRLYNPEKSLPYQYQALKLIQEIKNSARIYVHRIGFDPPPIKEDKRLTGDIKGIKNYQKTASNSFEQEFVNIRKAIVRLDDFINTNGNYEKSDAILFQMAGNELALKAIEEPGKYLTTLQKIKTISENKMHSKSEYKAIQKVLLALLPETEKKPGSKQDFKNTINSLFLNKLTGYE